MSAAPEAIEYLEADLLSVEWWDDELGINISKQSVHQSASDKLPGISGGGSGEVSAGLDISSLSVRVDLYRVLTEIIDAVHEQQCLLRKITSTDGSYEYRVAPPQVKFEDRSNGALARYLAEEQLEFMSQHELWENWYLALVWATEAVRIAAGYGKTREEVLAEEQAKGESLMKFGERVLTDTTMIAVTQGEAIRALAALGHKVKEATLRQWIKRGHVPSKAKRSEAALVCVADVVAHINAPAVKKKRRTKSEMLLDTVELAA